MGWAEKGVKKVFGDFKFASSSVEEMNVLGHYAGLFELKMAQYLCMNTSERLSKTKVVRKPAGKDGHSLRLGTLGLSSCV